MLFGYDILYLTDELKVLGVLMKKSITLHFLRFLLFHDFYNGCIHIFHANFR